LENEYLLSAQVFLPWLQFVSVEDFTFPKQKSNEKQQDPKLLT